MTPAQLFTTEEASEKTGVQSHELRRWAESGVLRPLRRGHIYVWRLPHLKQIKLLRDLKAHGIHVTRARTENFLRIESDRRTA
jgi:DNA-binding transcriptional MerR regulator